MTLIYCSIALAVGLFTATIVSRLVLGNRNERIESAGFAALGLLVGFLIGMSDSPIVTGALTGGLTFAGLLITKLWDRSGTKTETKTVIGQDTVTTTKTEPGQAKFELSWLVSISAAALLGTIFGATLRINEALNFRNEHIPTRLTGVGFSEDQVKMMMARLAEKTEPKQIVDIGRHNVQAGLQGRTLEQALGEYQLLKEELEFNWHDFWIAKRKDSAKEIVDYLVDEGNKGTVPEAFRRVINVARKKKQDAEQDKEIVKQLKALTDFQPRTDVQP